MPKEDKFETRGRKKEIKTSDDLQTLINEYFAMCEAGGGEDGNGVLPDEGAMLLYIKERTGIKPRDVLANEAFEDVLYETMLRRRSWLERKMVDTKYSNGCMNALKQPQNGGFTDRPQDTGDVKLKVNLAGIGGEKAAR